MKVIVLKYANLGIFESLGTTVFNNFYFTVQLKVIVFKYANLGIFDSFGTTIMEFIGTFDSLVSNFICGFHPFPLKISR